MKTRLNIDKYSLLGVLSDNKIASLFPIVSNLINSFDRRNRQTLVNIHNVRRPVYIINNII